VSQTLRTFVQAVSGLHMDHKPASTQVGQPVLAPQEELVLSLSMNGFTDKEVAAELDLSIHTVRAYWNRIRRKVGKSTRAEVIAQISRRRSETKAAAEADLGSPERRERQTELDDILGQAPVLLWKCRRTGLVTCINSQFKLFAGALSDGDVADVWSRVLTPEMRGPLHEKARAARLRDAVFEDEVPLRRCDGQIRRHLVREVPVYNDADGAQQRVGAAMDIHELRFRA